MAIIAVVGYLKPAATEEMPRRILFDSTGGKVIFSHLAHDQDYGVGCTTCHHETKDPDGNLLQCGTCHPPEFNTAYIENHVNYFTDKVACAKCHHAEFTGMSYNHDDHAANYTTDCTDCHHGTDIEPEPQNCADCHTETGDDAMPGIKDAAHQRCANCHQEQLDAGLQECGFCHTILEAGHGDALPATANCSPCHTESLEQLVPTRVNAFHVGCMSCHEKEQAGPYKQDDCNKCHMPR